MSHSALAQLVTDALSQNEILEMRAEEQRRFHRDFESQVSRRIEEMRAEKRRAYDEARNITIR